MTVPSGAYALNAPTWDGTGEITTPKVPSNQGYDAYYARRKGRPGKGAANGQLSNNVYSWPLYVTDLDIDFQINGNVGQSRFTRDFYPQNFIQPSFVVQGQSRDIKDYGMMCEFVHMCQKNVLNDFSEGKLMQLQIASRGISGIVSKIKNGVRKLGDPGFVNAKGQPIHRTVNGVETIASTYELDQADNYSDRGLSDQGTPLAPSPAVTVSKNGGNGTNIYYNEAIRGPHKEVLCIGIVTNMQRIHQAGNIWPTWQFDFQVFRMISGPYEEGPNIAGTGNFKTWVDLVENSLTASNQSVSSTPAMIKQNATILTNTLKDSQNIFNSTSGHGSGSGSGGSSGGASGPAKGSMYDSDDPNASGFPNSPDAVAGYIDDGGQGQQIFAKFPNANHLPISREADNNVGRCLDCELACPGAYPPSRVGAWAKRRKAAGIVPVVYCDQSDYPGVVASLKSTGLARSDYKLWVAILSDTPPTFPISGFDVDAVQYKQNVEGVDISVYSDGFF